jgi:hypothetical protein
MPARGRGPSPAAFCRLLCRLPPRLEGTDLLTACQVLRVARARAQSAQHTAGAQCRCINALQKKAAGKRLLLAFGRIRCDISQEEGGDKNHQGELRLQRLRSDVQEP